MNCPKCKSNKTMLVEYFKGSPKEVMEFNGNYIEHFKEIPDEAIYDGWSELKCLECNTRTGRWSGKELKVNEIERRFGGEPIKQ